MKSLLISSKAAVCISRGKVNCWSYLRGDPQSMVCARWSNSSQRSLSSRGANFCLKHLAIAHPRQCPVRLLLRASLDLTLPVKQTKQSRQSIAGKDLQYMRTLDIITAEYAKVCLLSDALGHCCAILILILSICSQHCAPNGATHL